MREATQLAAPAVPGPVGVALLLIALAGCAREPARRLPIGLAAPDPFDGWACRSAFRLQFEPERRTDHIGFRVVACRGGTAR